MAGAHTAEASHLTALFALSFSGLGSFFTLGVNGLGGVFKAPRSAFSKRCWVSFLLYWFGQTYYFIPYFCFDGISGMQRKPKDRKYEKVYGPVWACIYCGKPSGKGAILGREHVIPLALEGNCILPRASCASCSKITGQFEDIVTNKNFGNLRRVLDMSSGRRPPKTDPIKLLVLNPDGTTIERYVSPSDYPGFLLLPKLSEPAILAGNITAPLICEFKWTTLSKSKTEEIAASMGGQLQLKQTFDTMAFARMIAKIGLGVAVGELGLENFDAYGRDFILGKQPNVIGGLVGQAPRYFPQIVRRVGDHHLYLEIVQFADGHLVLGGVQLFCKLTPFVYATVVGKLTPKESFWKWKGHNRIEPAELIRLRAQYGMSPEPPTADRTKAY